MSGTKAVIQNPDMPDARVCADAHGIVENLGKNLATSCLAFIVFLLFSPQFNVLRALTCVCDLFCKLRTLTFIAWLPFKKLRQ